MVISAHTRNKDDIYFIFSKILSVPDVLLAVHSAYTSRCPQTILKQNLKICIVMTPANHLN